MIIKPIWARERSAASGYAHASGLDTLSFADEYMHLDLYILSFGSLLHAFHVAVPYCETEKTQDCHALGWSFHKSKSQACKVRENKSWVEKGERNPKRRRGGAWHLAGKRQEVDIDLMKVEWTKDN